VGCGEVQYILVALHRWWWWWWWPRNISGGSEQADLAKDLSPPEAGDGKRKQERGRNAKAAASPDLIITSPDWQA